MDFVLGIIIMFLFFLMFIFEREREHTCVRVRGGGAERGRGRQDLKQAPGSELSAQSPTWDSNPRTVISYDPS